MLFYELRVGLFIAVAGLLPQASIAQQAPLICTVKQVLEVTDAGMMAPPRAGTYLSGHQFVVNRESGVITGREISTRFAKSISIVDKGLRGNSFRLVAIIEELHPKIFHLEIQTFMRSFPGFVPENGIPFSGYFSYFHISGVCRDM
jgi:hypothetical protein